MNTWISFKLHVYQYHYFCFYNSNPTQFIQGRKHVFDVYMTVCVQEAMSQCWRGVLTLWTYIATVQVYRLSEFSIRLNELGLEHQNILLISTSSQKHLYESLIEKGLNVPWVEMGKGFVKAADYSSPWLVGCSKIDFQKS